MRRVKLMIGALLMAISFWGCSEGDNPMPKPEPQPEVDYSYTLSTVAQTQYLHTTAGDLFYLPLASGEVLFDEQIFTNRTVDDGAVFNITLVTDAVKDPTQPQLPEGRYTLSMSGEKGTWSAKEEHNLLVIYNKESGAECLVPQSGSVDVKIVDGVYEVDVILSIDDVHYAAHYRGELNFTGSAGNVEGVSLIEFIDGECFYHGADDLYPDYGFAQIQMWDVEPDPSSGRVDGNLVKLKLYIPLPEAGFMGVPAGRYTIGAEPGNFAAEAGFDDGVNIPTGSYISQRTGTSLKLGMFVSGTIDVTAQGLVEFDLTTADQARVVGSLAKPMTLNDLTGGFSPSTGGLSTLENDVIVDLDGAPTALMLEYGDFYSNGKRNVVLQILDAESMMGFVVDLCTPQAERGTPLPTGTYTLDLGYHYEFTYAKGFEQMGQPQGTYYCNFTSEGGEYYVGNTFAPVAGGTIVVECDQDGIYTLSFDLEDDATSPHKIEGEWCGAIELYQ